MIEGTLQELKMHLGERSFGLLMSYIEKTKAQPGSVGEWTFFDDEKLAKAILLNKSNYKEGVKEYHKAFTDLHITLYGSDTIFTGEDVIETIEAYQQAGDYALVNAPTTGSSIINPDNFAIIVPNQIHANELKGDNPLKIVCKLIP